MKKLLLSMFFACLGLTSIAQAPLKEGDVAPNFTHSDINGISHNLYNYTDSGYTVILDISATWCGPCWNVHNSHVFDSLTKHYGTNGTITPKKIKFFYFEGDAATNNADLMGTGTNTQGNWVAGTNYTIIDDATIKTAYPIDGYPHFYVICPNRTVSFSQAGYSAAMLTEAFWVPKMQACPVKVTGTNAGTISVGTSKVVCAGSSTPLTTKIQNLGTNPLTSATVKAKVGATTIGTFNWSGTLNTYDFATVNIGNHTFNNGVTNVDYEVTTTGDVLATDNTKSQSSSAFSSTYKTWTLIVKTDQYPGETNWKVKNSTGSIVQQKTYVAGPGAGGAGGADAGKVFIHPMNLNASECYTIEVTDSYGDGLYGVSAAADTGYVKLYDDMAYVTPLINFGGGYGEGTSSIVKTGTVTSIDEINTSSVSIYPNPASTVLTIEGIEGKANYSFIDVLGRTVKVIESTSNSSVTKLNISDLSKGSYFLKINQNGSTVTKSIVVAH